MQSNRGGMGMHKHGVSGRVPVNTRAKVLRMIEANKPVMPTRPKAAMFESVKDLMKQR